jgi:hypothetical protein
MSGLVEYHFSGIRPDSRAGSGYGNTAKSTSGVGRNYTKNSYFPYNDPVEDVEDQDAIGNTKTLTKFNTKLNRNYVSNNPAGPFYTDRGAFVNGASRIDLIGEIKFSVQNTDLLLEMHSSLGGISQLYAMGNGAGIYKTRTGKTIGVNFGSPRHAQAVKTKKRIYRLKDLLLPAEEQEDKEENEEKQV